MADTGSTRTATPTLASPNASLRRRMLFVLLLAAVPGMIVAVLLTVQKFREETRQIETSVTRLAALGAAQHQNVLTNASTLLEALVQGQQLETIENANCESYLEGWSDKLIYFTSLTLFDTRGQVVCTNLTGKLPYQATGHQWFDNAINDQRFTLSDYEVGRDGTPHLIAALPVISDTQKTIGVVALSISLNWLDFIASNIELPPEGSITALGPEGQILTHRGTKLEDRDGATVPPPSKAALGRIETLGEGTVRATDEAGTTRVYGFNSTKLGGVVVVVGLPQFVEYTEWTNALVQTLMSPIFVLILALLAAAWASEAFVVRHVRSLIGTAEDIAAGNLQARSDVEYDEHELGQLAAALDTMADSIEESHNALQEKSEASDMIAREMQHRIGNALAMAQAIAAQTVRNSNSNQEFVEVFNARLRALSISNQLLLKDDWKSADLRELVDTVLEPHAVDKNKQFKLEGPQVHIDSRATLAISLAIHELATNAIKYGALSQEDGRVVIHWRVSEKDGQHWLIMDWKESGGPRAATPTHRGFGSQMIQAMVERKLGGRLEKTFAPEGLQCEIAFPLHTPQLDQTRTDEVAEP